MRVNRTERASLIRLAATLERGTPLRRAVLRLAGGSAEDAPRYTADVLTGVLEKDPKAPWSAAAVWGKLQKGHDKELVDDIINDEMESDAWPESDEAAFDLQEKLLAEVEDVQESLERAWKEGKLVRVTNDDGNEWAIPGSPAGKDGKTPEEWEDSSD